MCYQLDHSVTNHLIIFPQRKNKSMTSEIREIMMEFITVFSLSNSHFPLFETLRREQEVGR